MNSQNRTRGMVEAALMTALTCLFAIVGTYIPLLAFVLLFIPIPFIVLGKRYGIHFVLLAIISSAIIIGSLTEPIYSIFVIVLPGITAIVMGYMMYKEYSPPKVLLGGAVGVLLATLLSISLTAWISGVGSVVYLNDIFKEAMETRIEMSKAIGMEAQNIKELQTSLEASLQIITMIVPAAMIVASFFMAYINYVLSVQVLKRIGYRVETLGPFREFSLPKTILMGTLIIGGLTMLMRNVEGINYTTLAANVLVIFQFIYLLQGLAVVSHFLFKFNLGMVLKSIIFILVILNQMALTIIAILGFIDIVVDFRKLNTSQ